MHCANAQANTALGVPAAWRMPMPTSMACLLIRSQVRAECNGSCSKYDSV